MLYRVLDRHTIYASRGALGWCIARSNLGQLPDESLMSLSPESHVSYVVPSGAKPLTMPATTAITTPSMLKAASRSRATTTITPIFDWKTAVTAGALLTILILLLKGKG